MDDPAGKCKPLHGFGCPEFSASFYFTVVGAHPRSRSLSWSVRIRSLRIMAIGGPILSYKYLTFKWSVKRCQRAFFVAEVFCDCVVVWWSGVLDSVCALVGTALFNTTMRDWTVTTPAPAPTPRLCPSKLWRNTFPACVALRIVFRHSLSSSQFDFQEMTLAVF